MKNYELLLRKLANSFAFTTGLDPDDLYQEASLAYLEALQSYDPSRGALTTHIWHCVSNHLKTVISDENRQRCTSLDGVDVSYSSPPFWEKLNKEAQIIADVILSKPEYVAMKQEDAQIDIVRTMLEKGWNWSKIMLGMKDLRKIYA
jgi:DNA-directed RNA polymerase specialized sigma24 family protein